MMSHVLDSLDRISSSNLRAGDLEVGEVVFECGALDCCPINAARSMPRDQMLRDRMLPGKTWNAVRAL